MLLLTLCVAHAGSHVLDVVDASADFRYLRTAEGVPHIPRSAYQRAEDVGIQTGLVWTEGSSAAKGWGVAVLDVPVEAVWMALNDAEAYAETTSSLQTAVIRGHYRKGGRLVFQMALLPLVADRWWVVEQDHSGELYRASGGTMWEMSSHSVDHPVLPPDLLAMAREGVQLAWSEGAWLLMPLDAHTTLVEYYVWSDPGGNIPAGPTSRFVPDAIVSLLANVGDYAASLEGTSRAGYVRPDQRPL